MNIKKLASLLFQRSVIVALLIFLQAAMLLLYMLWFSSDFIYVYWGCIFDAKPRVANVSL